MEVVLPLGSELCRPFIKKIEKVSLMKELNQLNELVHHQLQQNREAHGLQFRSFYKCIGTQTIYVCAPESSTPTHKRTASRTLEGSPTAKQRALSKNSSIQVRRKAIDSFSTFASSGSECACLHGSV